MDDLFNRAQQTEIAALREQVRILMVQIGRLQTQIESLTPAPVAGAPEVIFCSGIRREPGWEYFINENADIARRVTPPKKGYRDEVVMKTVFARKEGYLYYLDDSGDVVVTKNDIPQEHT